MTTPTPMNMDQYLEKLKSFPVPVRQAAADALQAYIFAFLDLPGPTPPPCGVCESVRDLEDSKWKLEDPATTRAKFEAERGIGSRQRADHALQGASAAQEGANGLSGGGSMVSGLSSPYWDRAPSKEPAPYNDHSMHCLCGCRD